MLKGVDIGGSFVKVLWEDGRKEKYFIRDLKKDKSSFLKRIREIILEGSPTGVGIAVAGFTSKEGKVYRSPNIPVLDGVDFNELLRGSGVDFVIGNDVSVGAYGEWFFDHRDSKILVLVAVGTGLGGGLVVEGKPFFGVCGSAMEIGHHTILKGGRECHCGSKGCWEAYCSSYGLEKTYVELGGEGIRDFEIVKRAKEGEERARRAVETFKEHLYVGLMNMVHIFNPDTIVLGGGVIEGMRDLLEDAQDKVRELSENLPGSYVEIAFSTAGEFLGARGALAFIRGSRSDIRG